MFMDKNTDLNCTILQNKKKGDIMLTYTEILKRIENYDEFKADFSGREAKPLVKPFQKESLQSVSYDIKMTNQIQIANTSTIELIDLAEGARNLFQSCTIQEKYQLKPNEFVLVQTKEYFAFPDNLAGHMRPRTTFNKLGLMLTSQHINPSFEGHLWMGIKNVTNHIMVLSPDLVIGQVVFEKCNEKIPESELYANKATSKYQGETEFIPSKVNEDFVNMLVNDAYQKLRTSS